MLKVYYKDNIQAPFREAEWVRVRELFFDHFVPKKDEALAVKEGSPLEYMPLIAEEFWRATGLRLHGLPKFTLWIKRGSYYHGLLVEWDQIQECPHLIGTPLPRWPQPKPSESHQDSCRRAEGPAVGSSEPSAGATAAPTQETPVEEPPVAEAPVSDSPRSDTPALMETGGAGDGQSWAEQVKTGLEAEFRQARPPKRPRSQSRKWETRPALPFPLQDTDGRLASVTRLYEHAGEQPPPPDDVAGRGIRHLHPEILPQDARCLGNQVVCMIAEYHLTSSAWVWSTLCPVLPEAAKFLLPALKTYVPGVSFEGNRDVKVLDRAKVLRVAVWLHRLDMSVGGDQLASETLVASWHSLGCLLESFLVPTTNDLTFREVIERVLYENRRDAQHRLNDLVMCCTRIHQELDDLIEAHREASGSSQKRIKKEIDLRRKNLESLKERISQQESHLQEDMPEQDVPKRDDLLDQGAEAEMATAPRTNDAPFESALAPVSDFPPSDDHAMEVDGMKALLARLQLALSPKRMTTCSMAMMQLGWRLA